MNKSTKPTPRHSSHSGNNSKSVNIMLSRNSRHSWGNTTYLSTPELGLHSKKICQICRITKITIKTKPGTFPISHFLDSNLNLLSKHPDCKKKSPKLFEQLNFEFPD